MTDGGSIDGVLRDQSMKVSPCNSGFPGGRNISTGFAQKAQDGLTLELTDQSLLAGEKPVVHRQLQLARLLQMERQVTRLDRTFGGEHHGALDDIFQLSEIAGPAVPVQKVEHFGRDAIDLLVDLGRGGTQEVVPA